MEFVFAVDPQLLSIDDEVPNSVQTSDAAITRADSYENFETTQEDNGGSSSSSSIGANGRKEARQRGEKRGVRGEWVAAKGFWSVISPIYITPCVLWAAASSHRTCA